MKTNPDVIIIGGGLAGLVSAIHLSKKGLKIIVIEKAAYPRHKVCGEYISNEILPYFEWLDIDISPLQPTYINDFEFTTSNDKVVKTKLPLGGFGISRYALDYLLYQKAVAQGCTIIRETVTNISFQDEEFTVTTSTLTFTSRTVLGAYGKRSNIDHFLSRDFITKKSHWLAIKAHYSGDFPEDLVALHNFKGGYCGISKVENGIINICYLADYKSFKKFKNTEDYQRNVLYKNTHLKALFEKTTLLFDKPLTISQISFEKKIPVENHIIMIGDSAGLIHPLCGNGMAIAIHSAKIASELVLEYHAGTLPSRQAMEEKYSREWKKYFSNRLFMGRILAGLLRNQVLTTALLSTVAIFPKLISLVVKQTHGKPINVD